MNFWELVTTNSTLQVSPENNFWDHLNNLGEGSAAGAILHVTPVKEFYVDGPDTEVSFLDGDYQVVSREVESTVEIFDEGDLAQYFDDEIIAYVTP